MNKKKTLLICLIILIAGGVITAIIFSTEPTASRAGATKETAMLVDVIEVERGSFHPTIEAMGTVQPSQDITLSPRVSGEIIDLSDAFTPGGFVEKGEVLLRIDPSDYKNTLLQRKSELRQALADLNIEMGRQDVARRDYQLIGDSLASKNKSLVLREPQLDAVRSQVESARAAVRQAELDLRRTTIRAPFDAHILNRNANVGSQVAPGNNLGRLVGLDVYWVVATVPLSNLRWLTFPDDNNEKGSKVRVRNRTAWLEGEYRTGYLYRLVGALEDQTRMARVLVSVPDPMAYRTDSANVPRLMIGAFVEANITANELTDVIRLNRDYIRKDGTVWVMKEGKLRIRKPDIIFRDAKYAYVSSGLRGQDKVVTTNLSTVTDGSRLRLERPDSSSVQEDTLSATAQPDQNGNL